MSQMNKIVRLIVSHFKLAFCHRTLMWECEYCDQTRIEFAAALEELEVKLKKQNYPAFSSLRTVRRIPRPFWTILIAGVTCALIDVAESFIEIFEKKAFKRYTHSTEPNLCQKP